MSRNYDAITAARFEITIDGHMVGQFTTLKAASVPLAAPRGIAIGELPALALQQTYSGVAAPASDRMWRSRTAHQLQLHDGNVNLTALQSWKLRRSAPVVLTAIDASGRAMGRYRLHGAELASASAPSSAGASSGTVAMEQITIAHEGFQRT